MKARLDASHIHNVEIILRQIWKRKSTPSSCHLLNLIQGCRHVRPHFQLLLMYYCISHESVRYVTFQTLPWLPEPPPPSPPPIPIPPFPANHQYIPVHNTNTIPTFSGLPRYQDRYQSAVLTWPISLPLHQLDLADQPAKWFQFSFRWFSFLA